MLSALLSFDIKRYLILFTFAVMVGGSYNLRNRPVSTNVCDNILDGQVEEREGNFSINYCGRNRCVMCKDQKLDTSKTINNHVTGKTFVKNISGDCTCTSDWCVYLISCKKVLKCSLCSITSIH